jgi:hypothetical protein
MIELGRSSVAAAELHLLKESVVDGGPAGSCEDGSTAWDA